MLSCPVPGMERYCIARSQDAQVSSTKAMFLPLCVLLVKKMRVLLAEILIFSLTAKIVACSSHLTL